VAFLALRKNAVDNASNLQRRALKWVLAVTPGREGRAGESVASHGDSLMDAPVWDNGSGVEFYVYDTHKWTVKDMAILAKAADKIASLPADFTTDLTRAEAETKLRTFVRNNLVWPIVVGEDEDQLLDLLPLVSFLRVEESPYSLFWDKTLLRSLILIGLGL